MSDETTQMVAPVRRYQLALVLGADDWDELVHALEQFAFHADTYLRPMADGDVGWNGASGGVASGYSYDVRVDPTMTHERYVEELNAHIAFRKELKVKREAEHEKYLTPSDNDAQRRERDMEHG